MQTFGGTETCILCYTALDDPHLPGTAGHMLNDLFYVRIVDSKADAPVPLGESGEVLVRRNVIFEFRRKRSSLGAIFGITLAMRVILANRLLYSSTTGSAT